VILPGHQCIYLSPQLLCQFLTLMIVPTFVKLLTTSFCSTVPWAITPASRQTIDGQKIRKAACKATRVFSHRGTDQAGYVNHTCQTSGSSTHQLLIYIWLPINARVDVHLSLEPSDKDTIRSLASVRAEWGREWGRE